MKIFKGLAKAIINMFLVASIFLIVLSFSVKALFSDIVLKSSSIVTKIMSNELAENVKTGNEEIDSKINELLENKDLKELTEKYIGKTLEGLASEEALDDVNIEKDVIDFVKEHEELIEEKLGVEIKPEYYDKLLEQEQTKQLTEEYKKAVIKSKESMPEEMTKLADYFNFFTTSKCRLILFSILIFCVLCTALLQKSFYKWIKTLAIDASSSGLMLFIMALGLNGVMNYVLQNMNGMGSFSATVLIRNSLITLASGLVVLIIYNIIEKVIKSNKNQKED